MSFLTVPQDNERRKRRHRGWIDDWTGLERLGERGRSFTPDPSIEHIDDEFDPYLQGLDGYIPDTQLRSVMRWTSLKSPKSRLQHQSVPYTSVTEGWCLPAP